MKADSEPGFMCSYNNGFKLRFENGITVSAKWSTSSYCSRHEPANIRFNDPKTIRKDLRNTRTESPNAEVLIGDATGELMSWGMDTVRGFVTPDQIAVIIAAAQSARAENLANVDRLRELGLAPPAQHTGTLESVRMKLVKLGLAYDFDENLPDDIDERPVDHY